MKLSKCISIIALSSIFLCKKYQVNGYSFHPISHANQQLFAFERIPSHEVRKNVHAILKNFLTIKVKNLLKKFPNIKTKRHIENEEFSDYTNTLLEQARNLMQQSENKRKISYRIKESYDKAIEEVKKNNGEYSEKNTRILKQNLEQINYLLKQAEELEKKAEHLKEHAYKIKKQKKEKKTNCSIKKTGILKYVSSGNGLKHAVENVQIRIEEDGLSLYYKNEKKKMYSWNLIEVPIKVIGNVKQCFFFSYKNQNQIFCGKDNLDTYSWINALSEGFFCHNFGIKGTVLNQTTNLQKIKETNNNNDDILVVDIKPEENNTRVFINGIEQEIENSKEIDVNKLKSAFEEERKTKNDIKTEESKD